MVTEFESSFTSSDDVFKSKLVTQKLDFSVPTLCSVMCACGYHSVTEFESGFISSDHDVVKSKPLTQATPPVCENPIT